MGRHRLPDEIQGRFRCFQLQGISQGISEDFKVFRSFQESLRRDPKRFFLRISRHFDAFPGGFDRP